MKKTTLKRLKKLIREKSILEGFNDGRFMERTIPDKRKKKPKHKAKVIENEK